jgi:Na+/H+ antiporter NhaC
MKSNSHLALLPAIVFLVVFALLNIIYSADTLIRDNSPIFAGFMAVIVSFFTFQNNETFNERINIFIKGSNQSIVVHMCYVFFLSTIFTTILEHIGSIASGVNLYLQIVPTWLILPGLLVFSSFASFVIGTSLGVITAFIPVTTIIAKHIAFPPSLIAATIVSGAIFGDNLSILSDTTIVSVKIAGTTMTKKLWLNIKIAIPAFITTIALLAYENRIITMNMHLTNLPELGFLDLIKGLPYILTFYLVLTELDAIFAMVLGIMLALVIGIWLDEFTILTAINFLFDGFYNSKDMVNVFILVVLLSGLSAIMIHNGAINLIFNKLKNKILSNQHAKFTIFFLVGLINITIAINSIAIVISGPIVKQLEHDFSVDPAETACILDITSCVFQGLLPYSPQLLLAASMAQVSTISLLPYLYYQYFLAIALLGYMTFHKK